MADRQQFANNAVTTMAGTLSSGGTTFTVAAGTGSMFPALSAGQWFEVTVYTKDTYGEWTNVETMKITGRTADTFTVGARDYSGQVGNPAGNAYDGITDDVFVEMLWTAESAESLQDYADAVVAEGAVEVVTHAATSKATPVDADEVPLVDSAASWGRKKLTWANIKATLKTYFDTLYSTVSHNHSGVYEPADADTTKNDVANTFTAQQSFTGTSATAPAIAGASDPNTGVFFPAADTVAVATNGTERMRVSSSGSVGIGTSVPTQRLTVQSGNLELKGAVQQILFNTNTPANNFWIAANITDELQEGFYIGKGGTGVGIGTAGSQTILKIDSSNNVLVTGSGGLGYGVGSGGSVTQATSKSTAVTLNKPCGQITMHNAALAAGASVTFTMVNSFITPADGLLINIAGGMTTADSYRIGWYIGNTGSGLITLTNQRGVTLSESLVLSFQVIKGAIS